MTNIGVFDSGLGGLTVLKELSKKHKANYFYFGDNKNVPYGDKSSQEIINLSKNMVKFLLKKDIDFFVVACNTISVVGIDELRKTFDKKFISITDEAVGELLNKKGDAFVMATKATCLKHGYKEKIQRFSDKKVYEKACPSLVSFIENGEICGKDLENDLKKYLDIANERKIENIILGCTHYPIIRKEIEKNLTYRANIIDPAKVLARDIVFDEDENLNIEIYMTDVNEISQNMTNIIMGREIEIKKVSN